MHKKGKCNKSKKMRKKNRVLKIRATTVIEWGMGQCSIK